MPCSACKYGGIHSDSGAACKHPVESCACSCYRMGMGLKAKQADSRERAKRAALNALKRARRAAERSGAKLSDWEGEFLGSVEERVEQYGRAFRDPEKGEAGASLSVRQRVKLKEIGAKANGKAPAGSGWRKKRRPASA